MLLVNNPGDWEHLYAPLAHAEWNGWTFTDLIFPFFLFIGGVSMALSLQRQAQGGAARGAMLGKLLQRAAVIFMIGLALNLVPQFDFATLRIPGVLQRIALCTALAAPLAIWCGWRALLAWIVALLAAYSVIMLKVPVPDPDGVLAAGALEPGRDVGAYVDRLLLSGHLWAKSRTWDPEGLFSTLPAVCSQLFGVLAGRWLLAGRSRRAQCAALVLTGMLMLLAGSVLDVVLMPINKSLWTPSYSVFMTGWALLLFAAFCWLLDVQGLTRWAQPLVIYGMNALFIFAFSGLVARLLGYYHWKGALYAPLQALPLAPAAASLLYAVLFNAVMFAVAWAMWRKRIFIKI